MHKFLTNHHIINKIIFFHKVQGTSTPFLENLGILF